MKGNAGFTLAEMAIVVLLLGIMMSMGVGLFSSQMTYSAISATRTKQELLKQALINYMRSNGKLPCPSGVSGAIPPVPTGIELAACTAPPVALGYGVPPWATLGLSRDTALDGWGNFFTYRVADINPAPLASTVNVPVPNTCAGVPQSYNANQIWTSKSGTGAFDIGSLKIRSSGGYMSLQIDQRDSAGAPSTINCNAVAVIYSHGKNGFGAITVKGTTNDASTAGADEVINSTAGTTRFIIRDFNDVATSLGGAYDDMVMHLAPQDLLQPLMNEGTLKACYAYCSTAITSTCTASTVGGGTCDCASVADGHPGTPTPPCTACTNCTNTPAGTVCKASGIPVGASPITCP